MQEHVNLWRITALLGHLQQDMETHASLPDELLLNTIFDYFEHFSERVQSKPREILLYQRLRQRLTQPLPELDELEHDYLSAHESLQRLRVLLRHCMEYWPQGCEGFANALKAFIEVLRQHIRQEEHIIIPAARKALTAEDWDHILHAKDQYNDPLFGERVRDEFRELRHRIIQITPEHLGGFGMIHSERMSAPHVSAEMLQVRGLTSSYGRIQVLHEINLSIHAGEIVSLVGANGAGKSTLLMTLSGLQPVDHGELRFEGEDLRRMPSHTRVAKGIVQVPEGRQVFRDMSVYDNLCLGAYAHAKKRSEINHEIERVYAKFPILRQKHRELAGMLSGGQQQMLAIGRALMAKPRLLLLDEPSMGLAPLIVEEIFHIIRELKNEGITIFLVEQNASQALALADRGYVLEVGRIVLEGSGHSLLNNEQVRSAYLGL